MWPIWGLVLEMVARAGRLGGVSHWKQKENTLDWLFECRMICADDRNQKSLWHFKLLCDCVCVFSAFRIVGWHLPSGNVWRTFCTKCSADMWRLRATRPAMGTFWKTQRALTEHPPGENTAAYMMYRFVRNTLPAAELQRKANYFQSDRLRNVTLQPGRNNRWQRAVRQ